VPDSLVREADIAALRDIVDASKATPAKATETDAAG
jgi:hypothetical protein